MLMLVLSSAAIVKSEPLKLISKVAERIFAAPAAFTRNAPKITARAKVVSIDHVSETASAIDSVPEAVTTVPTPDPLEVRSSTADKLNAVQMLSSLDREPQFKGGMLHFYQFLALNLQYPEMMMRYNIQGKVIISLIVEKDGSLSDIKPVKDIGYGSAEEAIRVLKRSPKWEPGIQNGVPVKVRYMLPINFNLQKVKGVVDTVSKVTFNYKEEEYNIPPAPSAEKDTGRRFNMILGDDFDFSANALYLVDGKQVPDLDHVDFTNVTSIKLVKHPAKNSDYVIKYGEKALNGVVLIESKK
jgi:hypothetical protein